MAKGLTCRERLCTSTHYWCGGARDRLLMFSVNYTTGHCKDDPDALPNCSNIDPPGLDIGAYLTAYKVAFIRIG